MVKKIDPWQAQISAEVRRLSKSVDQISKTVTKHDVIINKFNGDAIVVLKEITPQLKLLANNSNRIMGLAESKADDEVFWRGLKKRLNPLRPIGFGIWAVLVTSISGLAVKLFIS